MKLSLTQNNVAKSKSRFRVVCAGRRWGKTFLAIRELCWHARNPDQNVYYIAPSYRQAKTIVWSKLKAKLLELNWVDKVNETELTIYLVNGSQISLKGADNPDSLRGVSLNFCVFDEFAFMSKETWTEVIRPALSDQKGKALFITTPLGKSNWAYDLFNNPHTVSDWESFTYTTLEGGRVTAEEIEAAKAELDERTFRQEFMATFETYGNTIAYQFDRTKNISEQTFDTNELHIGIDFNNSPITAAIMVRVSDALYVIDEIHMNDSHTQELADEILNRYPKSKIYVYPDPAGRQRKTSANGKTDFTILQNAGFIVKAPFAHTLIRDRINALNARICSTDKKRHLFVNPKCKHTIESLEKYAYKEGTQVPDKGKFDHMFDALSYAVEFMFPLKKNQEPIESRRFGPR